MVFVRIVPLLYHISVNHVEKEGLAIYINHIFNKTFVSLL